MFERKRPRRRLPLEKSSDTGRDLVDCALITRWSDRARERHAREARFQAYEHYRHIYWENRVAQVEIVDTVGKGGSSVTFNVKTLWKLR